MITIREFTDPVYAGLILSFLRDSEVDAVLADENSSAWIESRLLIPIRLQVPRDQEERANHLLAEFDSAPVVEGSEE